MTEAQARLAAAEQEVHEALDALGGWSVDATWATSVRPRTPSPQTTTLLDAVGRLAGGPRGGGWPRVALVRAETEKDLAEARSLVAAANRSGLRPPDRPGGGRADVRRRGAAARRRSPPADPLTALRQLEEADIALEQALSVARDAQTQTRRAAAALSTRRCSRRGRPSPRPATSSATRRGAVGPEARTRLAEAQRHLDVAVRPGPDPTRSQRCARRTRPLTSWRSRRWTARRTTSPGGPPPGRRLGAVTAAARGGGGAVGYGGGRRPAVSHPPLGSLVLGG